MVATRKLQIHTMEKIDEILEKKIKSVVLYVRSLRQFSNIFFNEDILHTKKAYKAHKQLLLRYFYTPKSI